MTMPRLPFSVLVVGPFGPVPESGYKPRILNVSTSDLDAAMAEVSPSLHIQVSQDLCPDGALDINLQAIKDLDPERIVKRSEFLKNIDDARAYIVDAFKKGVSAGEIHSRLMEWKGLPVTFDFKPSAAPPPASKSAVDDILNMVASGPSAEAPAGGGGDPNAWAEQLAQLEVKLLSSLFADPALRRTEAAWRGLKLLARQSKSGDAFKLAICPCSAEALDEALESLKDILLESPQSLVLIDQSLDSSPRSMELFAKAADLGETILAPVIIGASNDFFHLNRWDDLHKLSYLPHLLDEAPYAKWRRLREQPAANWLAVTLNRFLVRGRYTMKDEISLPFEEPEPAWLNSGWALACLVARRALRSGWPTRFIEYQTERLEDMGLYSRDGETSVSVEASIDTDRINQFVDSGFIPVSGPDNKDIVFVSKAASVAGGSLSYQFVLSRVVNQVLWGKDNLEPGMGASEVQAELEAAFTDLFRASGHEPPDDMEISVQDNGPGQPHTVSVSLTPPSEVLPSGGKVQFSLGW